MDAQGNLSDKLARSGGVICPPKCRSGDQATDPTRRRNAGNPAAGSRADQSIQ
jgi:hypothetical protein